MIYMKEGRTIKQKRNLVKKVTDAVVKSVDVRPESVNIIMVDGPLHNFARAGVLLSETK